MSLEPAGVARPARYHRRWLVLGIGLGVVLAVVVAVGIYLAPLFSIFGQKGEVMPGRSVPTPAASPPPLDSSHRINILLLGSDNDQKFKPDALLSQTMIVASIDPGRRRVTLLSLPRDLWVNIPGHGMAKIDAAYALGGAPLARHTVEADLKIPIHFHAWIGLNGLVQVVDRLGGVDLDVLHPILDDAYPDDLTGSGYGIKRVYIAPGPQHLDGVRALEYVRSRHGDLYSDFGRSTRQQQLLAALQRREKAMNLLVEIPSLARDLQAHVRTDLDLVRATQIALFLNGLRPEDIHQVYLSGLVTDATQANGEQVLIPDWAGISKKIREIFDGDVLP